MSSWLETYDTFLIWLNTFQLRTTITVDEPAPGLKAIFSFIFPDQKSGKVKGIFLNSLNAGNIGLCFLKFT